jgi:hypothetical protein
VNRFPALARAQEEDFRLQASDFRLQITDFRLQILDFAILASMLAEASKPQLRDEGI